MCITNLTVCGNLSMDMSSACGRLKMNAFVQIGRNCRCLLGQGGSDKRHLCLLE